MRPDRPARLYECLSGHARRTPLAEAATDPRRRLTYAELKAEVDDCAAAMITAGVEVGDRVATLAPPGLEFLVTFLASASVGAIWSGLNPRYADPELNRLIARLEPRLVFAFGDVEGRDYRPWISTLTGGIGVVALDGRAPPRAQAFDNFIASGRATDPSVVDQRQGSIDGAEPCLMVFTSGSTGAPKGVMISQAALIGASFVQRREWPAEPLRVLNNLPINHIGCVGDLGCYALIGGGALIFRPRFEADAIADVIAAEQVTVWGQVPTMFQLTLDAPGFDPAKLTSLQVIFWGGAHASPELVARLRPLAPRLATSYGQTETVGSITFATEGGGHADDLETVGRPVPPYDVRVVDIAGAPTQGEGEIQIRSPFAMSGYWRDLEASAAAASPDGWRRTGDVGVLTERGELRLIGRVHDVFKSGGYNIYPKEIEDVLTAFEPVSEAAVVSAPDSLYGAVAVAFVCVSEPTDEAALRTHARNRLANYKTPKRFVILDTLPRLAVGKIDKQTLKAMAAQL